MKTLFFTIIVVVFSTAFTSCLDDSDETPFRYLELAQTKLGESDEKQVVTDSELTLQFSTYPSDYEFNPDERVLVKYSVVKEGTDADSYDYLVDIYSIQDVILKDIMELDEENRDTIGDDQIIINEIWISAGYLNLDFSFYGDDKTHYINIVKDPEEQTDDPTEVYLQIRHNAREDKMKYRYRGLMSFYLEPLQVEGEDEITLFFENQAFYAAPYSTIDVDYEYGEAE